MGKIVLYVPRAVLYLCDYKNDDFALFKGLPRHFGYEDCEMGLHQFYEAFQQRVEEGSEAERIPQVLIFDEWGAYIMSRKKADAEVQKQIIATLAMLGRSYKTHIILGLQRCDATHYFTAGAKDQFTAILAHGNLGREARNILFSEYKDELVNDCGRGTGYFLRDGKGLKRFIVPAVRNMDALNTKIAEGLTRNA
jgi:glutaredoxin